MPEAPKARTAKRPDRYVEERYQPVGASKDSVLNLAAKGVEGVSDDVATTALKQVYVSQAQAQAQAAADSGNGSDE